MLFKQLHQDHKISTLILEALANLFYNTHITNREYLLIVSLVMLRYFDIDISYRIARGNMEIHGILMVILVLTF